jgi:hypothetical protein
MTTQFPHATEEQLLEFYLCGMRTAFSTEKAAKAKHKTSIVAKCNYCPSFHSTPSPANKKETISEAREAFSNLLTSLSIVPSNEKEPKVESLNTDVYIIRSSN